MAGSRNVLGRGIGALISPTAQQASRPDYFLCAIDRVRPMRGQPRVSFDEEALGDLARSIEASGVLQPCLVRRDGSDYVLIAGERRWRAAQLAGLTEIPVVVKEASESEAFTWALVENLQREDLSPLETAEACRRLIEEHDMTQAQVAERIGKSRSAVANTLRLLKLGDDAQTALAEGRITEGHARQLVGLEDDRQLELVGEIETESLSVRAVEARVRELRNPPAPAPQAEPVEDTPAPADDDDDDAPVATAAAPRVAEPPVDEPALREAAAQLQEALATRVTISGRGTRGQIRIDFESLEVLEGIVDHILSGRS